MDTHEQAIKTYKALQERKKQRERNADAVLFTNINRVQKARYRQYWTRGVK